MERSSAILWGNILICPSCIQPPDLKTVAAAAGTRGLNMLTLWLLGVVLSCRFLQELSWQKPSTDSPGVVYTYVQGNVQFLKINFKKKLNLPNLGCYFFFFFKGKTTILLILRHLIKTFSNFVHSEQKVLGLTFARVGPRTAMCRQTVADDSPTLAVLSSILTSKRNLTFLDWLETCKCFWWFQECCTCFTILFTFNSWVTVQFKNNNTVRQLLIIF